MNLKSRPDEELGDLSYYLSQYDFKIKYPGKNNLEADSLSRNSVLESDDHAYEQLKIVNLITLKDIINDQNNNENVQNKKNELLKKRESYFKKCKNTDKIILSEKFSVKFLQDVHQYMCHMGIKQMKKTISPLYTATNLSKNIKIICENCETCKKNKSRGNKTIGLMSQLGPATKPFEIISIDTIGGFGISRLTK
ncbi:hypothetical protein PV326_011864, partial [Microctonus aethiopoides]